jgi:hypothetical protein
MRGLILLVTLVSLFIPVRNAIAEDKIVCEPNGKRALASALMAVLIEVKGGDAKVHKVDGYVVETPTTDAYQTVESLMAKGYSCIRVRVESK